MKFSPAVLRYSSDYKYFYTLVINKLINILSLKPYASLILLSNVSSVKTGIEQHGNYGTSFQILYEKEP